MVGSSQLLPSYDTWITCWQIEPPSSGLFYTPAERAVAGENRLALGSRPMRLGLWYEPTRTPDLWRFSQWILVLDLRERKSTTYMFSYAIANALKKWLNVMEARSGYAENTQCQVWLQLRRPAMTMPTPWLLQNRGWWHVESGHRVTNLMRCFTLLRSHPMKPWVPVAEYDWTCTQNAYKKWELVYDWIPFWYCLAC